MTATEKGMMGWQRAALLAIAFLFFYGEGKAAVAYETPAYEVLSKEGVFEIRQYSPYVVAEVKVTGERKAAANEAFKILAGYIFGKNEKSGKLAMTAPVTQTENEKIAMTAPVTQTGDEGSWNVQFMMPSAYTLETLPKPLDERIVLRAEPAKKAAVIRFSGNWGQKNFEKHKEKLEAFLQSKNLPSQGAASYAFYNAPFIPPLFRRNEILINFESV